MRFRNRLLCWIVTAILLFSTAAPEIAQASGQTQYFTFTNVSTSSTSPTIVNSATTSVSATFNDVVSTSISYTVTQIVGGVDGTVAQGAGQAPNIVGNQVTFSNIPLFTGLNRVDMTGTNASNQQVENSAYIYYSNNPGITNIQTSMGQAINGTMVVTSTPFTMTFDASNATSATVNGTQAFNSGGNQYIASNIALQSGDNPLTMIATNQTQSFSTAVNIVYFNGNPTPYGLTLGGASITPSNNPTLSNFGSTVALNGQLAVADLQPTVTPTVSAYIDGNSGTSLTLGQPVLGNSSTPDLYPLSGSLPVPATMTNGPHALTITVSYNGTTSSQTYAFRYVNPNTPYFASVSQLFGVHGAIAGGSGSSYADSTAAITGTMQVNQLPLYLDANIPNGNVPSSLVLQATQNGTIQTINYQTVQMADGTIGIAITQMPEGAFVLTLNYNNGAATDTLNVNSVLLPSIQLTNITDGQVFQDSTQLPSIQGKLSNFDWVNYQDPNNMGVTITVNGTPVTLGGTAASAPANGTNGSVASDGTFSFPFPGGALLPGANHIVLTATVDQHAISTSITVYYLSNTLPSMSGIVPVPVGASSDTASLFSQTGTGQYATTQSNADILGNALFIDKLVVMVNGTAYTTLYDQSTVPNPAPSGYSTLSSGGTTWYYNASLVAPTYDSQTSTLSFRLTNLQLQQSGSTNVTLQAFNTNGNQVSTTITMNRTIPSYSIVSPNLTNNGLVNSNFVPVIIQAEAATSVVINKLAAQSIGNNQYAVELEGLRPGLNTIQLQITRGTAKTTGSFTLNYVNQSTVGAQYKSLLSSNGTFSAFNNALSLTFPKNTVLEPANPSPGQQEGDLGLTSNQYILAGIANSQTGSITNSSGGFFPPFTQGFVPAGNVYWLDAGFQNEAPINSYTPVGGFDPYGVTNTSGSPYPAFYTRGTTNWMQPTSSGTLTFQYDPSILNSVQTQLTVFHMDHMSNTWENIGGIVNVSNHTITVPFHEFGYYAVMEETADYQDIITHPYARNALSIMYAKGIMLPKSAAEFGVYDDITRAEFAEMMVKVLGVPLVYDSSNPSFDDVPAQIVPGALWDYRYIETAVRKGVIRGIAPRLFAPNDNLTREQAAVMIAKAANYKLALDPTPTAAALQTAFTDGGTVDFYAAPAVLAVYKAGVIQGLPTDPTAKKTSYYFNPQAPLTRADAAVIALRMMQQLKLLPTTT